MTLFLPACGDTIGPMTLTQEQKLVLDTVRQVAKEVLYPLAPEYDRKGEYPWPQLRALAELGFLGMTTPEEWGGVGLDSVTWPWPWRRSPPPTPAWRSSSP